MNPTEEPVPDQSAGSAGRIIRGVLGVGAVRVLIVLSPLILLPILLGYWGVGLYGSWITANAIAGFLNAVSISILPLMTAWTALKVGAGDMEGAAREFTTLAVCSALGSVSLAGLTALAYWLLAQSGTYDLAPLDVWTVILLFVATGIAGLASIYSHALGGIGGYGLGNATEAARRGAELVFTILAVVLFQAEPLAISAFMIVTGLASLAWTRHLFRSRVPWGAAHASFDPGVLRRAWGSMSGSILLAAAVNQVMVVAPRILIEHLLGAREVVQFATISNLCRGVRQLADILVFPFQPEFSFAAGSGRLDKARTLFLLSSRLAVWLPAAAVIVLLVAGPDLIRLITGGDLVVSRYLFTVLALAALLECVFLPGIVWTIATGRVLSLALAFLFSGGISIGLATWLSPTMGLSAFAYSSLITALVSGAWATRVSLAMLKLEPASLVRALRRPPVDQLGALIRRMRGSGRPL